MRYCVCVWEYQTRLGGGWIPTMARKFDKSPYACKWQRTQLHHQFLSNSAVY